MPGAWLILPTYNEAVNLEPFVRAVLPEVAEAAPDHRILIVDDNSPDGLAGSPTAWRARWKR